MKNFELNARAVKAAMVMQAKNDVRDYLNGLLIGDGSIVATDGHRMIVVDCEEAKIEPTIFAIKGTLPKSASKCEFVFIGDDHGVVTSKTNSSMELDKVIKFSIVEGRFPDYKKVMPSGEPDKISEIAFNMAYLADISKAADLLGNTYNIGKLQFHDKKVSVEINTAETKATCVIMSARI